MNQDTCDHEDYDEWLDICNDCGQEIQYYTSCMHCDPNGIGELTIPIVGGCAPDTCDDCIAAGHTDDCLLVCESKQ